MFSLLVQLLVFKESQDSWKAIVIDEFQDTSSMQYDFLRILASHNRITVVGDDDQVHLLSFTAWELCLCKLVCPFFFFLGWGDFVFVHCKSILFKLLNFSEVQYNMSYCSPYLVSTELTFLDLIHFAKIFQTTKRFALPLTHTCSLIIFTACMQVCITRIEFDSFFEISLCFRSD